MVGMIVVLLVIWVGFHFSPGGTFLTPRNLWNLSVQTSAIAIMATGMVLVIVSRNIDLSVGSMVGVVGMVMAMMQAEMAPRHHRLRATSGSGSSFSSPAWSSAPSSAPSRASIVAYVGVPSFIVTLGGLLVWRGLPG